MILLSIRTNYYNFSWYWYTRRLLTSIYRILSSIRVGKNYFILITFYSFQNYNIVVVGCCSCRLWLHCWWMTMGFPRKSNESRYKRLLLIIKGDSPSTWQTKLREAFDTSSTVRDSCPSTGDVLISVTWTSNTIFIFGDVPRGQCNCILVWYNNSTNKHT